MDTRISLPSSHRRDAARCTYVRKERGVRFRGEFVISEIWNLKQDTFIHDFKEHSVHDICNCVYSIAFSPTGEYLASGSLEQFLHIWSLKEGKIVKTYPDNESIFEVCWNKDGDKIAGCFANNTVCVLDTASNV